MELSIEDRDGRSEAVLTLATDLGFAEHVTFFRCLDRIEEAGVDAVVVDGRCAETIDSAGLGMLLVLHESLSNRSNAIAFAIRNVSGRFATVLRNARIGDLYDLEDVAA